MFPRLVSEHLYERPRCASGRSLSQPVAYAGAVFEALVEVRSIAVLTAQHWPWLTNKAAAYIT
eukprot:1389703-Amphidinium_carterae.1